MQNRIVIAAPKSGSGKTLITIGLMKALADRGLKVKGFKCGPDYIDPMFHKSVLNIPSKNLDLFFTDENKTRELFCRDNKSDISVIEGVMGLFDGLAGISSEASTYHLAKTLQAPVILVVDAKGMGISVMAEIAGFLSMDEERLIKGVILNRMSKSYYESMKPVLEEKLGIPVLGFLPVNKELNLESRHLGLITPNEIEDLKKKVGLCAGAVEENIDIDALIKLANSLPDIEYEASIYNDNIYNKRIAVARDEAFCFIYDDNIALLERLGCSIEYFSPLRDMKLPEGIDGLILYGGYPELYASRLSGNSSMLKSIRDYINAGGAYLAECGGFMYLHEALITKENAEYKMVGAIPGKCFYTGKLVRFGYASFQIDDNEIRGHEFHYYDSENNGEAAVATKPVTNKSWKCIHKGRNYIAGFPHLYYESNEELVYRWVKEL